MADIDKTEFEFPDEVEEKASAKQGEKVVEKEDEIEIVDDTPEDDRGREPMKEPPEEVSDDELAKYDEGVQKRIKRFTKGYHDERRAKEAALREREAALEYAQKLMDENNRLKGSYTQSQTALIAQATKVAENELERAKTQYKRAYESGDSDSLLEAQTGLNAAQAKIDRLKKLKPQSLQSQTNQVQTQPKRTETPVAPKREAAPVTDPDLIAWQERNPWFGNDRKMTAYALGLHEEVTSDGIVPGSKEYYRRIDADMKATFPAKFGADDDAEAPKSQPARSNVAPATRSVAPRKITLTKSQVAIAKRLGLTNEQYAREVAKEMRK